jgi:hypothetical protein
VPKLLEAEDMLVEPYPDVRIINTIGLHEALLTSLKLDLAPVADRVLDGGLSTLNWRCSRIRTRLQQIFVRITDYYGVVSNIILLAFLKLNFIMQIKRG